MVVSFLNLSCYWLGIRSVTSAVSAVLIGRIPCETGYTTDPVFSPTNYDICRNLTQPNLRRRKHIRSKCQNQLAILQAAGKKKALI